MRAPPLEQWAELDAILQSRITSPYPSPIFRSHSTESHVGPDKATQIDMLVGWSQTASTHRADLAYRCGTSGSTGLRSFSPPLSRCSSQSASEGINVPQNAPSILSTLQENVRAIRAVLDRVEALTIPSHASSPIIHIHLHSATPSASASAKAPDRGYAGRSPSRRGRVSASPSRRHCRARCVSVPPALSRLLLQGAREVE